MPDKEHVRLLMAALASANREAWNQWRVQNPDLRPDLSQADLGNADLRNANLSDTNMSRSNLADANLTGANLNGTNFTDAILTGANLSNTDLRCAHLRRANLTDANLNGADLRFADLHWAILTGASLHTARVIQSRLKGTGQHLLQSGAVVEALKQPEIPTSTRKGRLAKLALGLFRRKEMSTLELKESKSIDDQPAGAEAKSPVQG